MLAAAFVRHIDILIFNSLSVNVSWQPVFVDIVTVLMSHLHYAQENMLPDYSSNRSYEDLHESAFCVTLFVLVCHTALCFHSSLAKYTNISDKLAGFYTTMAK